MEKSKLADQFKNEPWFHSMKKDNYGRYIVYANWLDEKIMGNVPEFMDGNKVLLHYSCSDNLQENKYISTVNFEEIKTPNLLNELDRLEGICGEKILANIFYEVHDRQNATSNYSKKYPQVRESMENLYKIFGFNNIHDQFE